MGLGTWNYLPKEKPFHCNAIQLYAEVEGGKETKFLVIPQRAITEKL